MRIVTASNAYTNYDIFDKNGKFLPYVFNFFGGFRSFGFTLAGSESKQLTVDNDARFAILLLGRYNTHQGLIIGGANTQGAVTYKEVVQASNISYTTATNKLTIVNGHSSNTATCLCIMLGDTATVS